MMYSKPSTPVIPAGAAGVRFLGAITPLPLTGKVEEELGILGTDRVALIRWVIQARSLQDKIFHFPALRCHEMMRCRFSDAVSFFSSLFLQHHNIIRHSEIVFRHGLPFSHLTEHGCEGWLDPYPYDSAILNRRYSLRLVKH